MPNRILKESILTSVSVDALSGPAERYFYRLLTLVDDYGRFDARPSVIRGRLFPLKLKAVSDKNIADWMEELIAAGIVRLYGARGASDVMTCQFFEFVHFTAHQGAPRAKKSKFPDPEFYCEQTQNTCEQMQADVPVIRSPLSEVRSPMSEVRSATRVDRAASPPKTTLALSGFEVDEELARWVTTELYPPLTEVEALHHTEEFSEYWEKERPNERKALEGWKRTWRNKMRWASGLKVKRAS